MTLGYNSYGALYYELYEATSPTPVYTADLQSWHDFL